MRDYDKTFAAVRKNREDFRVFKPLQWGTPKGVKVLQPGDFMPECSDQVLRRLWQNNKVRLTSEFPPDIKFKKHRTRHKPKTEE